MTARHDRLMARLGIKHPIIQAPMAGVSTPAMAAAVTNAGGLGSLSVGATDWEGARAMMAAARELTSGPVNINLFCHRPAKRDAAVEAAWIDRLRPAFDSFGAVPPAGLTEIYRSFIEDEEMYHLLPGEHPAVVSFHFGLPPEEWVRGLAGAGILLLACATSLAEARAAAAAGVHAAVAQGWEAGGHRGVFHPEAEDDQLGTLALTRLLVLELELPVIAAGGIMDGAGIAAALRLGAAAAQLGTALIACDESGADPGYRAAIAGEAAGHTVMTRAISGRPARSLPNLFTALTRDVHPAQVPAYPVAYALGKALHAAAAVQGEYGFGAHWAGQGAPLSRAMPTARLMELLKSEMETA